jgi:SpoVK/Ycf46/Vps4 family AAA+-type ATPase
MAGIIDDINKAITGRYPIIYLNTAEEGRIITAIEQLAKEQAANMPVISWSCSNGLVPDIDKGTATIDTRDPVTALETIIKTAKSGFYIMKDLPEFMDQAPVNRALRDAYTKFSAHNDLFIFIVSPRADIPEVLSNEIYLIDVELPNTKELLAQIKQMQTSHPGRKLGEDTLKDIAFALNGLTLNDASHIMHQICSDEKLTADAIHEIINSGKKRLASGGTACLEYIPVTVGIDQVGGLDRLKEWIEARKQLFSHKSQGADMPVPRGILFMGISGCGKSICAKVVADTWKVPLYRLDMNLIFSDLYGNPEAAFHKAVHAVEAAAPAVLWIDEIENGMGLLDGGNSNQSHIFSAFLTWMQEKPPLVFVAATANRIESLPAELIRKGRFDQVFFCDLPDEKERAEILRIHIKANKQNPDDFDIPHLTDITKEWNAAELEQAVQGGRIDASNENRAFTTTDIARYIDTIVPLSETMSEQIKRIRDWAWDRATPASKGKGKGRELSLSDED